MTKDEFKKVENTFHNFNETPEVIGIFKEKRVFNEEFGKQVVLTVDDKEVVLGAFGVLNSKLTDDLIGKTVKIVFIGEVASKTKGHKPYKNFEVYSK